MADHSLVEQREILPTALPTLGEEMAAGLLETVETDMVLAVHRRNFASAQQRLRTINCDFKRMIEDLHANYSETEAVMVELYIESCRREILSCYLTANRNLAVTPEGKKKITTLVESLINDTLRAIRHGSASPEAKQPEGSQPDPLPEKKRVSRRSS
jgi:hypothetical protein